MPVFRALICAILLCVVGAESRADPVSILSELKGGVLAHDLSFLGGGAEGGADVNAEVLFLSPEIFEIILAPRPHIGIQINTQGDTSQIYAGLTWTFFPLDRVWIGVSGGGSVHNGDLGEPSRSGRASEVSALGSRVLFRLAAEIGVQVNDRLSISLIFDHESNANLADENEGLNNAGLRVGYRF